MGLGQRLGATAHKKACRLAAGRGSLDVLKLFREQGCPWDKFTCALALPRPLSLRFCASSMMSSAIDWFVHFSRENPSSSSNPSPPAYNHNGHALELHPWTVRPARRSRSRSLSSAPPLAARGGGAEASERRARPACAPGRHPAPARHAELGGSRTVAFGRPALLASRACGARTRQAPSTIVFSTLSSVVSEHRAPYSLREGRRTLAQPGGRLDRLGGGRQPARRCGPAASKSPRPAGPTQAAVARWFANGCIGRPTRCARGDARSLSQGGVSTGLAGDASQPGAVATVPRRPDLRGPRGPD